jgi:hypothetical protein
VHKEPHKWGKYMHLAEWHYNTSVHASTGFTPFQIVFGKTPPTLTKYIEGLSNLEAVHAELTDHDYILEILRKKLEKAQSAMKHYADQRRIDHPFKVGDLILVKLRPYRQTSAAGRRNNKLSNRFFGPFKILRSIGEVAFELQLPETSKIHPVFHVSKLKPFHGVICVSPYSICVICEICEFISIGISFELGFSSVPIDPQACGTTSILRLINFHYVQLHHAMCQKIHITLINWIKIRVRGW